MGESVTFLASFPAIQSAIKVYGDKQGCRIQLDIPESEMGAAIELLLWRERVLEITVRPCAGGYLQNKTEEDGESDGQGRVDKGTKRKPEWASA